VRTTGVHFFLSVFGERRCVLGKKRGFHQQSEMMLLVGGSHWWLEQQGWLGEEGESGRRIKEWSGLGMVDGCTCLS
jgi:hypothetical protein